MQIVTSYKADEESKVLDACERMHAHLTAAIVSNDLEFAYRIIGNTVNGTTYWGTHGAFVLWAPRVHKWVA